MVHYNHYFSEVYGLDSAAQMALPPEQRRHHGVAVLLVAAADGDLSKAELDYFVERVKAFGAPAEMADALRHVDLHNITLESVLEPIVKYNVGRSIVYDAIKVASVDGYHEKEKAAVAKAAKILGVDGNTLHAIESLVIAEAALRDLRISLFAHNLAKK